MRKDLQVEIVKIVGMATHNRLQPSYGLGSKTNM
jgi:hypothetical protein